MRDGEIKKKQYIKLFTYSLQSIRCYVTCMCVYQIENAPFHQSLHTKEQLIFYALNF